MTSVVKMVSRRWRLLEVLCHYVRWTLLTVQGGSVVPPPVPLLARQQVTVVCGRQQVNVVCGRQQVTVVCGRQQVVVCGRQQVTVVCGRQQVTVVCGRQQMVVCGRQQLTVMCGHQQLRVTIPLLLVPLVELSKPKWRQKLHQRTKTII